MKKRYLLHLLWVAPLIVATFNVLKDSPEYVSVEGELHQTNNVEFLYDLTYEDQQNNLSHEQEIFQNILNLIDEAEEFVVLDLFLFNDDYDHRNDEFNFPALSSNLAGALIQKRSKNPEVDIYFVTDPINTFYGTYTPNHIQRLMDHNIKIVETDLSPLRDSNPLYSGIYRTYLQWFTPTSNQYLPNIFRPMGPKVNIGSYLSLLNFKANHRKTVMNEKEGLVTSWNPHDASGHHSNIAFVFEGNVLNDLLESELAVFSDSFEYDIPKDTLAVQSHSETDGEYGIKLITELAIKNNVIQLLDSAERGDQVKAGMFYLSERDIIDSIKKASDRGVDIQLILDINQDAFGSEKIGIPNRPVASELIKHDNINIRWYQTHDEQFHSKFIYHTDGTNATIIGGSANFTRRNLNDYNLETNVYVTGDANSELFETVSGYFNRIWSNEDGQYTTDYQTHGEDIWWKNLLYRIQEFTGLSTF